MSVLYDPATADPIGDYFENGYEEVTGLGDLAGFATRSSGISDVLVVVTRFDGLDRVIEIRVDPLAEPTADQVRPIAERVLGEID